MVIWGICHFNLFGYAYYSNIVLSGVWNFEPPPNDFWFSFNSSPPYPIITMKVALLRCFDTWAIVRHLIQGNQPADKSDRCGGLGPNTTFFLWEKSN